MEQIRDSDVLRIMIDGGEKLCDYALDKWISYAYTPRPISEKDEEMRREYISHWKEMKRKIKIVAKELEELYETP